MVEQYGTVWFHSMEQYVGTVSGTVEQYGRTGKRYGGPEGQFGGTVKQYGGTVEQWNSVSSVVEHWNSVEQYGTVWWKSGRVWQCVVEQ